MLDNKGTLLENRVEDEGVIRRARLEQQVSTPSAPPPAHGR